MSPARTRIVYQNIRSLHRHYESLKTNQNYCTSDILCLVESKLTKRDKNYDYELNGFMEIIRNDQCSSSGRRPPHGIAVYVRNTFTITNIEHSSSPEFEYTILKTTDQMGTLLQVVVLYKSDKYKISSLMNALKEINSKLSSRQKVIVVGDFNLDALSHQNKIVQMETILSCKQIVEDSTTVYNTLIDLAFVNYSTTLGIIESLVSDHKILTIEG